MSTARDDGMASAPRGLAAAAVHQLRGPLTSIRLRLQLLQDTYPDAGELPGVLAEVDRLVTLVDQILTWGAPGTSAPEPTPVEVLDVAAARLDAWTAPARERGVHLDLTGTAATALQVHGALEHSLDVLVDNALKVSPAGTTITCTVRATLQYVSVEVADQGPGMTAEELAHAQQPFWRGTSARTGKGTGLGLAIATTLLEASGGRLTLSATDPHGLLATATLPAAPG